MSEQTIEGKTLAQWKATLDEHRSKRPSNTSTKLQQWVYEKDYIQARIDELTTRIAGSWKPVGVSRG